MDRKLNWRLLITAIRSWAGIGGMKLVGTRSNASHSSVRKSGTQRAAGVSPAGSTVSVAGRRPAARCGAWRVWNRALIVAFAILIKLPDGRASIVNCTYDAAGRLVGVRYDSITNLTHHYDQSGSISRLSAFTSSAADVAVAEAVLPGIAIVGVPFKIRITAANLSAARATGLRLSSQFPAGQVLLSAVSSAGTCSINGTTLTCALGNVDAGEDVEVEVSVRATVAGPFEQKVTLSVDGDPNTDNNSSSLILTVLAPPALTLQASAVEGVAAELTWPASAQGLFLEETPSLLPPVTWKPTEQPSLVGDTFRFPIVVGIGNRFYRLRSPE